MRVDFTNLGLEPPEKGKTGRAGQTAAASESSVNDSSSTSPGADRTRFSFDQARVQSLEMQALAAPEVRQAKVQPLQQAVANGDYTVDSAQVANAIIADANDGTIR